MTSPSGNLGQIKGKRVPNLVMVIDNEKGSEFRVQCEVVFKDEADAKRVNSEVAKGTPEGLKRAKKLIMANIDPGATQVFRNIIDQAFDDNIKQLDMAHK